MGHKMFSDSLRPIPGYEGAYSITPDGRVVNKNNVVLKTFPTRKGEAVELRYQGQRERVLIKTLLEKLEDHNDNSRAD